MRLLLSLSLWFFSAGAIAQDALWADLHAHPSRFHRSNIPRILDDEIANYLENGINVVVCNISTDTPYRGGYVLPDGTEIDWGNRRPAPDEPWTHTLNRMKLLARTAEEGNAIFVRSPDDVARAAQAGKLGLIPALEGADGLQGDIEKLRELHRLGVGLVQLVHFRANELGHIQTWPYTPGGLTPFGEQVVREANELGIIVDLAHANAETIADALAVSEDPMLFSHTGARVFDDGDRALADAEITAIAAKGGVIGIWPNGSSVPRLTDMVRHIDHIKNLVGVEHVGIGSDLRGMGSYTDGFGEEARFLGIAEALGESGYSEEDVNAVMGGNFMRVLAEVTR